MLSKPETQRLFEKLREQDQRGALYELAARLQYGAGLRLSELVRMRVQNVDAGCGCGMWVQDVDPSLLRYAGAGRSKICWGTGKSPRRRFTCMWRRGLTDLGW